MSAPGIAYATDGWSAAQYAQQWAFGRNNNYPSYDYDCTNFASQALHDPSGGRLPYVDLGSPSPYAWWVYYDWVPWPHFERSNSWSVANDLRNFLLSSNGYGYDWGIQCQGAGCYNDLNNIASYGDILFYDWTGDGYYEHSSVETIYNGTDYIYNWFTGDLICQHTNDRRNAEWNLWDYNYDHRYTTKIDLVHIDTDPSTMAPGEYLLPGGYITSTDRRFYLAYQTDGNLVLYQNGVGPIWNTRTITSPGYAAMQTDGNFVLYWPSGAPYWATNTGPGNSGAWLVVQNDGNVVIYRSNGTPMWATGTCCR